MEKTKKKVYVKPALKKYDGLKIKGMPPPPSSPFN
jgi:hypothetical protein